MRRFRKIFRSVTQLHPFCLHWENMILFFHLAVENEIFNQVLQFIIYSYFFNEKCCHSSKFYLIEYSNTNYKVALKMFYWKRFLQLSLLTHFRPMLDFWNFWFSEDFRGHRIGTLDKNNIEERIDFTTANHVTEIPKLVYSRHNLVGTFLLSISVESLSSAKGFTYPRQLFWN